MVQWVVTKTKLDNEKTNKRNVAYKDSCVTIQVFTRDDY